MRRQNWRGSSLVESTCCLYRGLEASCKCPHLTAPSTWDFSSLEHWGELPALIWIFRVCVAKNSKHTSLKVYEYSEHWLIISKMHPVNSILFIDILCHKPSHCLDCLWLLIPCMFVNPSGCWCSQGKLQNSSKTLLFWTFDTGTMTIYGHWSSNPIKKGVLFSSIYELWLGLGRGPVDKVRAMKVWGLSSTTWDTGFKKHSISPSLYINKMNIVILIVLQGLENNNSSTWKAEAGEYQVWANLSFLIRSCFQKEK